MIKRTSHRLQHDPSRVIAKPYLPGEEIAPGVGTRAGLLMGRIMEIPEAEVATVLESMWASVVPRISLIAAAPAPTGWISKRSAASRSARR